jgi:heptosyltransferase-2
MALRKKVVVLYGPTNPNETHFYGRAEVLYPETDLACIPCLKRSCDQETNCMEYISAAAAMEAVTRLMEGYQKLTD